MEKICKYAVFNYQKVDEDLIEKLADYLDYHAKEIYDFFQISELKKPIIMIVPTKVEFDEIFQSEWGFPSSSSSRGFYKNGRIVYLSIKDYKNTSHAFESKEYSKALENFKKTLVHEFVHYVNELFNIKNECAHTIKYLREGIATYLSRQKDNMNLNFDYTLDQLLETDSSKSCYDGYYLVTKYLIENYDKDFVFEMFKSNRKAREFLGNELYSKVNSYYKGRNMWK